jgi:hypothetical protein
LILCDGSGEQPFDDFVGSGEHDSSAQIFLVGKNPLYLRLFDVSSADDSSAIGRTDYIGSKSLPEDRDC